jgi:NAD-dependent deacetylase
MSRQLLIESPDSSDWAALSELIRGRERVAVLTGAGISAESGLPTFRANGLWEEHRVEDVATPSAFLRDPALVWRFYNERRRRVAEVKPNAAHLALAQWEARCSSFTLITQNVDRLHQAAGSQHVLELHGCLHVMRCTGCDQEMESLDPLPELPRCECGELLRPGVVWFGEMLPPATIQAAIAATKKSQLFVVIGTSAIVHPAAGLIDLARERGAFVIEINPQETPATGLADAVLRGPAALMTPQLVNELTPR